jgi:transcriptional regulator with XRE-family HTH domain
MKPKISLQNSSFETDFVKYIVNEYFNGDAARLASQSGYSKQQIDNWLKGQHKPQKNTIRWLLSVTIAPEFKVINEFFAVNFSVEKEILGVLNKMFDGQGASMGIYAFYDSMCNLIYLGKASKNIKMEVYQQLKNPLGLTFNKAVKAVPQKRWQVVKFLSAYEVPQVAHLDYPKHVEALMLRIAKPIGNKVIGSLKIATPPKI